MRTKLQVTITANLIFKTVYFNYYLKTSLNMSDIT